MSLQHVITLQQLLTHLYILIPVCDNDKHYWVGTHEVEKLLEKGKDWLPAHPARELITMRYLKHQRNLANDALEILLKDEADVEDPEPEIFHEQRIRVHDIRLETVRQELLQSGAKTVVDLGCGEGKLLRLLLAEKQFEQVLGMDISYKSLQIAKDKLKIDRLAPKQQQRIQLIQGSLNYKDKRIAGFEGAALVEVIEHLDEPRLTSLEKVVFEFARPQFLVVTTPNAEYNIKFANHEEGKMRHADHRFEWTRKQFEDWGNSITNRYKYDVRFKPIGEADDEVGALSQMAAFTLSNDT